MFEASVTSGWKRAFPGAQIGMLLVGNVDNSKRPTALDQHKLAVARRLRSRFAGYGRKELLELDVLKAYKDYYKVFNKTYHVQLQLESVLLKGKSLPNVNPLVDANFAAELESMILTAGHDADLLIQPVVIDGSDGSEELIQLNGEKKILKPNDMIMTDAKGVVCSVIYGQDRRTPISPDTRRALYVAYVPPGIEAGKVHAHLEMIKANVALFAPQAEIEYQEVLSATWASWNGRIKPL